MICNWHWPLELLPCTMHCIAQATKHNSGSIAVAVGIDARLQLLFAVSLYHISNQNSSIILSGNWVSDV